MILYWWTRHEVEAIYEDTANLEQWSKPYPWSAIFGNERESSKDAIRSNVKELNHK